MVKSREQKVNKRRSAEIDMLTKRRKIMLLAAAAHSLSAYLSGLGCFGDASSAENAEIVRNSLMPMRLIGHRARREIRCVLNC